MTLQEFDCTVIGDVMLDVFVGHKGKAVTFRFGGTSYCDFAEIDFGGAGNVAAALSLLGVKASFVGKAGNDLWGRMYEENLKSNGVTTNMFFEKNISTGLALIALGKRGERSLYVFRGANDKLSIDEINKSNKFPKTSKYLCFSGFSLVSDPQKAAVLHAVKLARQHDVKVIFDPGAYNLVDANYKLFNELFYSCDVFCPNLDEAKATFKTHRLETVIQELRKANKLTALKCGARGCILISNAECTRVPGFKVNCVDTTGAGDAFLAALIFGLCKQFPSQAVGQLANWFAAQTVRHVGSRTFPPKVQITNFIETLNH
jgi:sugar/nucleoside kinase (ribokinase family)